MNKNKIIINITLLSIVAFLLIGLMVSMMSEESGFRFMSREKTNGKPIYTKEYQVEKIGYIDINSISADVFIYPSEDNHIKVEIYDRKKDINKYQVGVKEETLKINQGKINRFCIGFCSIDHRIVLYLPEVYAKDMKIHSVSGDITTREELVSNLDFQTVSGDMEVESVQSLKAKTTSGDIEIVKAGDVSLETVSGDIEVENLTLTKNGTIKTTSGDVSIEKTNNIHVITDTTSGDIEVENNNQHASKELSISTTSGDINVN